MGAHSGRRARPASRSGPAAAPGTWPWAGAAAPPETAPSETAPPAAGPTAAVLAAAAPGVPGPAFPSQEELLRPTPPARVGLLVAAAAVGILVSVGLGVYGRWHQPTPTALAVPGFASSTAAKVWLTSAAFGLALVQLATARGAARARSRRRSAVHRWSGRLAVLLTVPVAVHCLSALGLQTGSVRVLGHGLAGCLVYGAFATKMLVLARPGRPRWCMPLLGGLLFTALTAVWVSSAGWLLATAGPAP